MPAGSSWGGAPSSSPFLASTLLDEEKTATNAGWTELLTTPSFTPSTSAVTVHFSCSFGGNTNGAFELQVDGVKVGQVGASAWNGRSCVAISQRVTVAPGMPCVIGVVWKVTHLNTLTCLCGNPDYILDHASIVVTL